MRKAFNFYNSYYQVAKELPEKDRYKFLWAIIQRQFEGIEPTDLTGLTSFAYNSQKHSIDAQVTGYEMKTKKKLTPTEGGAQGGAKGGSVQGEGKEKGEVQYSNKPIKILFKDSELFDKVKFKEAFPEWQRDKLAYYYEQALTWSNEGNKKVDWKATVRTWASRDEKEGKLKFASKNNNQIGGLLT